MKKRHILASLLSLAFLLPSSSTYAEETTPLIIGGEEIDGSAIDNKYPLWAEISSEDLATIQNDYQQGMEVNDPNAVESQALQTDRFTLYNSKSVSQGSGKIDGDVKIELNWWNHRASGTITTTRTSGSGNTKTNFRVVGYGVVGSGGLGKTVDESVSSGVKSSYIATLYLDTRFEGNVAIYNIYSTGYIYFSSSTLSIPAKMTKQ
ncbi:hypothetical protein [Bacillus sp. UNCCL81]|uniref:hypothetical protein n=1 Tax=Bacillus sp. UNCCL81 TaxID=1502755 RepID=UPI0008EBF55A|nr:hypothetical protein [Bacillus sp. UNCCL81]SFD61499.1 hypothetical protein SAMN02799633_04293 [Bacillus sp. UNCCL81]